MESNKSTTLAGKFFPVVDGKLFLSTALSFVSLMKNGNTNQLEFGWRISAASLGREDFINSTSHRDPLSTTLFEFKDTFFVFTLNQ